MRVCAIAAFAAGIVASALLAGPVLAQNGGGAEPFVGVGLGYGFGSTEVRAGPIKDDIEYDGFAYELQLGASQIAGTGMLAFVSLGRWHFDAEYLGVDGGSYEETMLLANIGYEWDVDSGRPWLAFAIGKIDETAYGLRGGFKFEVGENLLIGPRLDLLVIDTNQFLGYVLDLEVEADDTGVGIFGVDFHYRF